MASALDSLLALFQLTWFVPVHQMMLQALTLEESEMSLEAKERGPEISWQGALLITGVALAYWVDFGFVQVPNQIWVRMQENEFVRCADIPSAEDTHRTTVMLCIILGRRAAMST